jgi:hypothetical protein
LRQRTDPLHRQPSAKFPTIAKSWRNNWARVIPFFAHPPEIRRVIYTTNAIESLNMSLHKVTKAHGSFPNDEAVMQTALPGAAQYREKVDLAGPRLEGRAQPLCYRLRRPVAGGLAAKRIAEMKQRRKNPGYGNRGKTNCVFPPALLR